jgi:cytochrome c peroxidase
VLKPIQDPNEMDLTLGEAVSRVNLPTATISQALASYVRSLLSGNAPYDRFINGNRSALSEEQQRGLQVFRGRGNCTACHVGPTFTDERFHNTGVAWRNGALEDYGRYRVTAQLSHLGAFKTPTLREVARTFPYMHDGSIATLEEVVDFYDRGGRSNPQLDPEIRPIRLTQLEKQQLVAFLKALSGSIDDAAAPRRGDRVARTGGRVSYSARRFRLRQGRMASASTS